MSFKAILKLSDKSFELQECVCGFRQKRDRLGKPQAGVTGGIIKMILELNDDDTFTDWIVNPKRKEDGTITFYRIDQESKFKQIKFEGAYLIDLVESFISDGDMNLPLGHDTEVDDIELQETFRFVLNHQIRSGSSYSVFCRISAEKINVDGTDHDNRWGDADKES
jgi:hypothetical protein